MGQGWDKGVTGRKLGNICNTVNNEIKLKKGKWKIY